MCSECFVQIKRADPSHTNPPSSEPAACPYCMTPPFGVRYSRAAEGKRGERKEETSAEEAQEIAEAAAAGRKVGVERNKTEEDVVWIGECCLLADCGVGASRVQDRQGSQLSSRRRQAAELHVSSLGRCLASLGERCCGAKASLSRAVYLDYEMS